MSPSLRVSLLVVFAMLAFASNSLLCRIALRDTEIDAASFTAIRLASGALMLIVLLRARGVRPSSGGSWPMAAMLFAYAAFFSFAYRDLTAATGALLLFGAVQLTMMVWALWQGERLAGMRLMGLTIAIAGARPRPRRFPPPGWWARVRGGAFFRPGEGARGSRSRRQAAISCARCL